MQSQPISVTVLGSGTSSGVPMIACGCKVCTSSDSKDKRLRSSILIASASTTIVIDTTPDFRYQMLRANVKQLHGVVFTHAHKDHVAGLDDVRAYNYFMQQPMQIFASAETQQALHREFEYVFADTKYPGVPDVGMNTIMDEAFTIGDIEILPINCLHYKMPVKGFRVGNFTYITDANHIPANEKEKIKGSEVLVLNALRKEEHISHFTLQQAITLADELNIPQAYFTHISHQMGLHQEVNAALPTNRQLAFDGMIINL